MIDQSIDRTRATFPKFSARQNTIFPSYPCAASHISHACPSSAWPKSADGETRGVMERRITSLVNVLSSVYHFLQEQKRATPRSLSLSAGPPTPSSASRRGEGGSVSGDSSEGDANAGSTASLAEMPPLKLLGDAEVVEALWSGRQSMIRRLVRKLEAVYQDKLIIETPEEEEVKVRKSYRFCLHTARSAQLDRCFRVVD